ncbi:MAG: hypothetical protein M0005_14035 [Actinomycetota bacterium]|jgi:hypothetical protein|nr:hypothetical protein [Actinomycetota bacterium]
MAEPPRPGPTEDADQHRIAAELADIGYCLPGSVTKRQLRCGKPGCACKADPPVLHGPYRQWSRKIGGKTVSRWLSGDQVERYEAWFANAKRARDLLTELEALSLRIAERTEGWDPQPAPTGHRARSGDRGHTDTGPSPQGKRRAPAPRSRRTTGL